jgi:hypothetical protein
LGIHSSLLSKLQRFAERKSFPNGIWERGMEQAADDTRFMTDLHEVMSDFAEVDAQWWEAKR